MRIREDSSHKRLRLVALLTAFLLIAVGCGGPQSSPKAVVKAYLADASSRSCSAIGALFYRAPGNDQADAHIKIRIADCENYTDKIEIDVAHLEVQELLRNTASPADKANGVGDWTDVSVDFAERQRGCSDCRWSDRRCVLRLQQYGSKWWISESNCLHLFSGAPY